MIKPQLQKLSEMTEEQVEPDAFQPVTTGKTTEQASPRAEERRGSCSHGAVPQGEAAGTSAASRREDDTARAEQEEPFQDGTYDCSVS